MPGPAGLPWCNLVVANAPGYRYVDWWRGEKALLDKDMGLEATAATATRPSASRMLRTRSADGLRVLTSQAQVDATRRCNERMVGSDVLLNGLRERYARDATQATG